MLTLRQIEVVRAVMITGSLAGAAKLLGVSAPGLSRLMKYTERSLGLRLFDRRDGRFVPSAEAADVFEQVNIIFSQVGGLTSMLERMKQGDAFELRIGSVPSIAAVMVPRAFRATRDRFPRLRGDINILKIEEAIDCILLNEAEVVAVSHALDHPAIDFVPLAWGRLFCIVPEDHELAKRDSVSAEEMVRHPLIGIDPNDPYGSIMARIFREKRLDYDIRIRARFGTTVCSLVAAGLGIAMIDRFTAADGGMRGIKCLEIEEPTEFQTYVAKRKGSDLSVYADFFVKALRAEMEDRQA